MTLAPTVLHMDRRGFLQSLFGIAVGAVIPASVAAVIESLAEVVALPDQMSKFSMLVSLDQGLNWTKVPVHGEVKDNGDGWYMFNFRMPVTLPAAAMCKMQFTNFSTSGDCQITLNTDTDFSITGVQVRPDLDLLGAVQQ